MPSYEDMKQELARYLGGEHNADVTAFGASDKEDKMLGPVRDFKIAFRMVERADFDRIHASMRHYLTDNMPSSFLTAFSAAEKEDREGGRQREFRICIRVPLLAGEAAAEVSEP